MDNIILTGQQKDAMRTVIKRLDNRERITTVAGYAGTGKTTLIRYIIEEMNLMKNTVFVSYTGRASLVLRDRGLPATTIHRLIYETKINKRTGEAIYTKRLRLNPGIRLIVIDEISMVPERLLRDLASYGIPVIGLGDPFQLPPVEGNDNGLLNRPHAFLSEIHRQSKDSEIIFWSMKIREGEILKPFRGNNVAIIKKEILQVESMEAADQIICGRNATRHNINNYFREEILKRKSKYPEKGDKLVCTKNDWTAGSRINEIPLINGMIGYANNNTVIGFNNLFDLYFSPSFNRSDTYSGLRVSANPFNGKNYNHNRQGVNHFEYGWAITVYKAQGSEFDNVVIFDEVLNRKNHARQIYTALTRARINAIIVLED